MKLAILLQKSWAEWDAKVRAGGHASEGHKTAARWIDHYAPHAVPQHGLKEGDVVKHISGKIGRVASAHSSGFITVDHSVDPKYPNLEEYHHSELKKVASLMKGTSVNNWKSWDAAHKAKTKEIFVGFKGRDGMHPAKAAALFDTMHDAGNADAYKTTPVSHQTFKPITGTRMAGETVDRATKVSHIQTLENAYNHAGFALTQKGYTSILKGKGPKGHSWKLVGGKRVYTSSATPQVAATEGRPPEVPSTNTQQMDADNAYRAKYQALDAHHYEAAKFHEGMANDASKPFTVDERRAHLAAGLAHRLASSNAQDALAHINKPVSQLYTGRQDLLSAQAAAATDKTSPVGSAKPATVTPENSHTSTPESHAPQQAQGVNHPNNHMQVANTILQQYGGNKFRAMTGANNFVASSEKGGALTFRLPRTAGATKGTKFVKTVHDPATDTYDVHMLGRNGDVKHSAHGIYADQLQSHFKHHTGLDTHL